MSSLQSRIEPAFEVVVPESIRAPILLTVEHASNRLPSPWQWGEDAWLQDMHWAWDPGAADLARELCASLGVVGVLARFTRLLVDPNRPLTSPTLFRSVADGRAVKLNADAPDVADAQARVRDWYQPYHDALSAAAEAIQPQLVLGVHTYTPVYEGAVREVEIGVLQDGQLALAQRWVAAMSGQGYDVRLDEPYAGDGFMYSPQHHADVAGCPAIELEIRNDHCTDQTHRDRIRGLIETAITSCWDR